MKKRAKSVPKVDPYIDGLMAKLLERLVSLEKKIDTVVAQTRGKAVQSSVSVQPPRHDRMLYEAVCADCSKVCEVPFKPSEDRAVYCKECFARRKSGGASNRPGMPVLTPVALPPKPVGKLHVAAQATAVRSTGKKVKKSKKRKK